MPQIFNVMANENVGYKRNELEFNLHTFHQTFVIDIGQRSNYC